MITLRHSLPPLALAAFGWASTAEAAELAYTVSSELAKPGCAEDADGDCLDDVVENQLAQALVPYYFYDEDEGCSGEQDALHYARKDFFQVRPHWPAMSLWEPGGQAKWVRVSYFWLHPHDCQTYVVSAFSGHQGDSENVYYDLYSYDLTTWYLASGTFFHHNANHTWGGDHFARVASELGIAWPIVAADEDGHGSWPGRTASSSDCAGKEDNFLRDCFVGSMRSAWNNGRYELPAAYRNVGGPSPERWNAATVGVDGAGRAYSTFDVGHGANSEYWTYTPEQFQFCGWECGSFQPDSDCNFQAHGDRECATGLWQKVDTHVWPWALCGDNTCNNGETCDSCPGDCGVCPGEVCGNGHCGGFEDCSTCAADCGSCEPPPDWCGPGPGVCPL